jgi:DnaJ-class molecular chaperone
MTCPECSGTGKLDCTYCDGEGYTAKDGEWEILCDICFGEGKQDCDECDGTGEVK